MSDHLDDEWMDDDVARLLSPKMRAIDPARADVHARVLGRISQKLALPSPPDGASDPASGGTSAGALSRGVSASTITKGAASLVAAMTFVLGIGAGVLGTRALPGSKETVYVDRPVTAISAGPVESAAPHKEAPPISADSLPAATTTDPSGASAKGLAGERALLDIARLAIARGEPEEAQKAVLRHERDYRNGALVEEREALAIKALTQLGHPAEARQRAKRFEERYPNSFLLQSVRGSVR